MNRTVEHSNFSRWKTVDFQLLRPSRQLSDTLAMSSAGSYSDIKQERLQ